MKLSRRSFVALLLVWSMVFPTALTYAQATESTSTESIATSSEQIPEEGATTPEVDPIAPPAETVTQSSTSTDELLQGADNPQDVVDPGSISTSTEVVVLDVPLPQPVDEILTDNPTTTDEVLPEEIPPTDAPPAPPEVEQEPLVDPVPPQEQPPVVEESQPVAIALEEIAPDPEYVFSVNTGKRIPAKRRVKEEVRDRFNRVTTVEKEVIVDNAPQVTPDNREGTMQITSSCTNKYYVVLVYKNEGDYDRDRTSYIVNKAYPCQGGSFTYLLDGLPSTLQNGTYFVLIGEQGDTGGWLPISGLTEITINRN